VTGDADAAGGVTEKKNLQVYNYPAGFSIYSLYPPLAGAGGGIWAIYFIPIITPYGILSGSGVVPFFYRQAIPTG